MAIFSKGTKKKVKAEAAPVAAAVPKGTTFPKQVIRAPRITEKATFVQTFRAYVFDVVPGAGKREVADEVRRVYGVTPRAVRIVPIRGKVKRNMKSGRTGTERGGRKAYVYLKEGDTITLA